MNLVEAEAVTTQPGIAEKLDPTTTSHPRTPTASKDHFKGKVSGPTRIKLTMPVTRLPPTPEPTPDHQLTRGTKRAAPTDPDSPSLGRAIKRLATTSPSISIYNTYIAKHKAVMEDTYTPSTPITTTSSISRNSTCCLNSKYAIEGPNGPVKIYQDKLCSLELRRLAREVMCQVDWEVAEDNIACNRPCVVYRRLVRRMLLEKADELEAEEEDEESDSDVEEDGDSDVEEEGESNVEEDDKLESEVGDEEEEE